MTARGWYDPTLPPDIRRWAEEGSAICTMVAAKWGKVGVISHKSNTRNQKSPCLKHTRTYSSSSFDQEVLN